MICESFRLDRVLQRPLAVFFASKFHDICSPAFLRLRRSEIFDASSIAVQQALQTLLAIPAFVPVIVCPGYVCGGLVLRNIRHHSFIERIFWAVPFSVAISPITSVLIGRASSLATVDAVYWAWLLVCVVVASRDWIRHRSSSFRSRFGLRPFGGALLCLAAIWVAAVICSVVDFQRGQTLLISFFTFDHSYRVSWIQSILRTGVPPANPQYLYVHPAPLRNYYFWYVLCAEVARVSRLPARAVLNASCIWVGFALAALVGLYLKHFLRIGARLRRQFLIAILLLAVTGLDLVAYLWQASRGIAVPGDLDLWSKDPIYGWYGSVLWVPHHVASLICCMFGFLLAWMCAEDQKPNRVATMAFISLAFASAFGLSVFVSFGFFLVMVMWGLWQLAIERTFRHVWCLACGAVGAVVLLIPYLLELTHASSSMQGGRVFGFGVREMIPPGFLLGTALLRNLGGHHPELAVNLAKLILLVPGYAVELGFYSVVMLIYLVPAWRGKKPLSSAERSLLVIALATLPVITFVRSWVLNSNDFGWRAAAILQFPLLLLASGLVADWEEATKHRGTEAACQPAAPHWLRTICSLALALGMVGTVCQGLIIRYSLPFGEKNLRARHATPDPGMFTHDPYISAIGYARLNALIPRDAVVQFNPYHPYKIAEVTDVMYVGHQSVITSDQPGCGSELGGDPSGCTPMAAILDRLYAASSAEQARAACHQLGIQYLVARIYDPAWYNKQSWVWTLPTVVADPEFRALDCDH